MSTSVTSILRKSLVSLVFVAGALAASAHAQTDRSQVRVAVPFAFQDGSTHLDSGVYTIGLHDARTMIVRGTRGAHSAFSIVNQGETLRPATESKVVFHKYGNRYFRREVWTKGSTIHLECPASRIEKNLQKELQLASNNQAPTSTEVALLELPN